MRKKTQGSEVFYAGSAVAAASAGSGGI